MTSLLCFRCITMWFPQCKWSNLDEYGDIIYKKALEIVTRTTKTLRSEIPPAAPWLPIPVIHIRSQVKRRQSQGYELKKNAKKQKQIWKFCKKALHATHFLKLLDKMHIYEMDSTRTLRATERIRDVGRADGHTTGWTEWNQYTHQQLRCVIRPNKRQQNKTMGAFCGPRYISLGIFTWIPNWYK